MNNSKTSAAKLVIRLPGSEVLKFAYTHLKSSPSLNQDEKLLEKFVLIVSQLFDLLLELHPFCCDQLDSLGIFEKFSHDNSVCFFLEEFPHRKYEFVYCLE
jgi:hypothetical protein